jgi:hypothetical protein
MHRKPTPEGLAAAENTLGGALRTGPARPLAEYVRIALEAAQPYEDEARNRELANRLDGHVLRVSGSNHFPRGGDDLVDALDDAMAARVEAGDIPDGELLAQVAYMTLAKMLREGKL